MGSTARGVAARGVLLLLITHLSPAASVNLPSAPSGSNILVVSSTANAGSGSSIATLSEYLPTTASQTTAVQSVAVTGCLLNTR